MHFLCISFFFVYILCVCVYMIIFHSLLMHLFHIHLLLMFIYLFVLTFFFQSDKGATIPSPIVPPFQKVCGNCRIMDVIISPTGGVHCNAHHSKSTIQKSGFLRGSIATNDEHVSLIIEGKWFEAIVHMMKSKFLDLLHPK